MRTYCAVTRRTRNSAQPRRRDLGVVYTLVIADTCAVFRVYAQMVPMEPSMSYTQICCLEISSCASIRARSIERGK